MAYFVTGATGFIGRFLVGRLLERGADVHVLVREGSVGKLDALRERWGDSGRIKPVTGDLGEERLGVPPAWVEEHRGGIEHFFHLAAIYDMTASDEMNERMNVGGTRNAVALANELRAGHLHHTSSVAAAGLYEGVFGEDMFDEGQPLDHPYHRTKFESERIAREESQVPWRVYRPAVVVGHSETGEMDKIDGPYYLFPTIKRLSRLPRQLPILMPRLGDTNVVPVDFVAAAMDHIAHAEGLDGAAFHLVNPEPQPTDEVMNAFCRVAGAPSLRQIRWMSRSFPFLLGLGPVRAGLNRIGLPADALDYAGFTCSFDSRDAQSALAGSGITVPALDSYAETLWDYWERNLAPRSMRRGD